MRPCFIAFLAVMVSGQSSGWADDGDTVVVDGHAAAAATIIAKWTGTAESTTLSASSTNSRIARVARKVRSLKAFRMIKRLSVLTVTNEGANASDRATRLRERIQELKDTGLFEYVEPDYVVHAYGSPTDAAFTDGRLWGLKNTGQNGGVAGADIDAVSAWSLTTGSRNVVVAVVDTGIRYTHQDLEGNMWTNANEIPDNGVDDDDNGYIDDVYGINARNGEDPMDDNNHGSHCAGIIGATANDSGPNVGVAWQVSLMALKFLNKNGSGTTSDAIECIDYAIAEGADILSNSWGGGGYSAGLYDAISRAQSAGILFVAASGNDGTNSDSSPSYPASYALDNVISVAALDRNDRLASFSNYGATSVDIGAPGVGIYSCTAASDTSYATYDGTSMATPYVGGVAALVKSKYPNITAAELKRRILDNARPISSLANKTVSGGALSASGALGSAVSDLPPSSSTVFSAENLPNTIPDRGSVISTLTISGISNKVAIENIVVALSIAHPHVADLVVKLKSSSGKAFTIWNRQGGDQKDLTINSSLPFRKKITVDGTWTLTVEDRTSGNIGSLNSWSITIKEETGS